MISEAILIPKYMPDCRKSHLIFQKILGRPPDPPPALAPFGASPPYRAPFPKFLDPPLNSLSIPWVNKVKYLGVHFLCNTGNSDLTNIINRFYSQFNNIMSVLGKGSHEMNAIHLLKPYCFPTLPYAALTEISKYKICVHGTVIFVTFSLLLAWKCAAFTIFLKDFTVITSH